MCLCVCLAYVQKIPCRYCVYNIARTFEAETEDTKKLRKKKPSTTTRTCSCIRAYFAHFAYSDFACSHFANQKPILPTQQIIAENTQQLQKSLQIQLREIPKCSSSVSSFARVNIHWYEWLVEGSMQVKSLHPLM